MTFVQKDTLWPNLKCKEKNLRFTRTHTLALSSECNNEQFFSATMIFKCVYNKYDWIESIPKMEVTSQQADNQATECRLCE